MRMAEFEALLRAMKAGEILLPPVTAFRLPLILCHGPVRSRFAPLGTLYPSPQAAISMQQSPLPSP